MKKQEEQRIRAVLFRESGGTRCDFPYLAKRTGIPVESLRRYKRQPDTIPLNRLLVIANAMGINVDDAGYMITGRKCR